MAKKATPKAKKPASRGAGRAGACGGTRKYDGTGAGTGNSKKKK